MESELSSGHPVNYLFRRELQGTIGNSWKTIIDRRLDKSSNLFRKNLTAHFGCVNAIEFSSDGTHLVSGGDDRQVLLWNLEKVLAGINNPVSMQAEHLSNIFCLSFDNCKKKIFSAGNDDFVIIHDIQTGVPLDYFMHEQPVFGISVNPLNDNVFSSACDDGRILIFDAREPSSSEPFCLAKLNSAFHSVMFNPNEPRLLVSANSKEGVALWDVRTPKTPLMRYAGMSADQCCMSARFNSDGSQILALRRRLPPVLYATDSPAHLFQFNHPGYYNSCTMKSCSFAGSDDQYILSGSDNFDLYMWQIPAPNSERWVDKAHMVLKGHRSIVNQVRYNPSHSLIASSGVEKLIKLWSPFPITSTIGGNSMSTLTYEKERHIYTNDEYIDLIMQSGQFMSLNFDSAGRTNTKEDPRMMAFFDALVQRDINGLSDESEDCARETSYTNLIFSPFNSDSTSPLRVNDDADLDEETRRRNRIAALRRRPEGEVGAERNFSARAASWVLRAVSREHSQLAAASRNRNANRQPSSSSSDTSTDEDEDDEVEASQASSSPHPVPEDKKSENDNSDKFSPQDNVLTRLIVQREDHLRKLARMHVLLEASKKSKRKSLSSSESSAATCRRKKQKNLKKYEPSKSAKVLDADTSSSDDDDSSAETVNVSNRNADKVAGHSKYFYRNKYTSASKKTKSKKRNQNKSLSYVDYKKSSERSNSCNYWNTKNAVCNGSTFDVQTPSTSSKAVVRDTRSTSDTSSPSSSSESNSSDSSENFRNHTRKPKHKAAILESSNDSSSSTTHSSNDSSEAESNVKNSIAFKASPLIRRIELEKMKKRRAQKTVTGRKKVGNDHVKCSNSSRLSGTSIADSTDDEPLAKRIKERCNQFTSKEVRGRRVKVIKNRKAKAVVTTDSGIDIEKSMVVGGEPQPCCSKDCDPVVKKKGKSQSKQLNQVANESSDNLNSGIVTFRKRTRNKKRQYRQVKDSTD